MTTDAPPPVAIAPPEGAVTLVARLDADGDVLLAGPAVRAVAARAKRVVLLCGPRGRQAAALLPGVDEVLCWTAPWIEPEPPPATTAETGALMDAVQAAGVQRAVLLTSFHQNALPLALILRMAGVGHITAISEDYPGSLLDSRVFDPGHVPESERGRLVAARAGYPRPPGDNRRLAVRRPLSQVASLVGPGPYVVLHPGTSVPARAWPPARWGETASLLAEAGRRVVVTGGPDERDLTAGVAAAAGPDGCDLGGRTSFAELAGVLAESDVVVVGNTGPAHLAAAVGTPVVSLFAPTVPAARWAPYGVPSVVLGDQGATCHDTRAIQCPVPGHPCLSSIPAEAVLTAVTALTRFPRSASARSSR